ncbi:hypothetical protein GV794_07055 [Nocardia cyriacigeorgica]|uniref:DUF8020 domain-containing protein n=1 Tax=Nocardia cyriacigeorgica TaxID=135487 RepID=A0A6P1DAF6_9NOCA|nr:hypothetical protein [Nocardia cyriacigeorgica]NEW45693.1 hypothetical protein [Nocardia cyriacigeorgica]NEW55408.1 hypothetical protein [Nocardia cyriacigeorgica]
MNTARIAGSIVAATSMAVLSSGTAHAGPAEPVRPSNSIDVTIAPGIHYTGNTADNSVVVSTVFGSLTTKGSEFRVLDVQGNVVAGQPPTRAVDTAQSPIAAAPDIAVAATTAGSDSNPRAGLGASDNIEASAPTAESATQQIGGSEAYYAALGIAATQFGLATGVGSVAGGVIGLGVGCVAGALTGGFVALPTGPVAAPAAAFGCIIGASLGAGIGAVVGGAALGIPVGVASAVEMYNTLHAAGEI